MQCVYDYRFVDTCVSVLQIGSLRRHVRFIVFSGCLRIIVPKKEETEITAWTTRLQRVERPRGREDSFEGKRGEAEMMESRGLKVFRSVVV